MHADLGSDQTGPERGIAQADLLGASLAELMGAASAVRDAAFGTRMTFSPKVFIPLTMLCRDRCGYCTFAKAPARLQSPYLSLDEVLAIARAGRTAGCHEALFTLGEGPEDRYPAAAQWLDDHGYSSTVDYLAAACAAVLEETGLLPHANAGALAGDDLATLRSVSASQGMMIESTNPDLDAHRSAPDKVPARRLATLEAAGELSIPFTTGLLVGIGESRQDRIDTLVAIAASHARHGHVQEVIVQNFLPKTGTSMHRHPPCPTDEFLWTIAAARLLLPTDIHLQAPPNLSDELGPLVEAGIDDWGGVSPVTADHVNPERAWPALGILRAATESAGHTLAPRLTLYPEFALTPATWLDPALRFPVLDASDAEGLGRDHPWASGGEFPHPSCCPRSCRHVPTPAPGWSRRPPPAGPSPRCWPACWTDRPWRRTRSSPCSVPEDPRCGPWPRSPTSSATTSWATRSPTSPTATSTTRTSARSSASSAPSPKGRCRSTYGGRHTCWSSVTSPTGWPRPRPWAPPKSASRAASTPSSTATTTSR